MMPTTCRPARSFFSATALVAALLAACSTPGTRVVLLPQADGKPSAVVVRAKDGEEVLSKPYQRATAAVGASGAPVVDQADAAKVQAENKPLFDMRPPPPQRYTVFFELGGTTLTPASQQIMSEALAAALARSGGDIVVTGHTDTKGQRRAERPCCRAAGRRKCAAVRRAAVPGQPHRGRGPRRARTGRADRRRGGRAAQPARHDRSALTGRRQPPFGVSSGSRARTCACRPAPRRCPRAASAPCR
jgi:OOP family OmpA-OmpF porin